METFTIPSLIDKLMGTPSALNCSEYEFDEKREYLTLTVKGEGTEIAYRNDIEENGWEPECELLTGFYPLIKEETVEDIDDGVTPMRSYSYKYVVYEITMELPDNWKDSDTFTPEQLRDMVTHTEWLHSECGSCGEEYHNWEEV